MLLCLDKNDGKRPRPRVVGEASKRAEPACEEPASAKSQPESQPESQPDRLPTREPLPGKVHQRCEALLKELFKVHDLNKDAEIHLVSSVYLAFLGPDSGRNAYSAGGEAAAPPPPES